MINIRKYSRFSEPKIHGIPVNYIQFLYQPPHLRRGNAALRMD